MAGGKGFLSGFLVARGENCNEWVLLFFYMFSAVKLHVSRSTKSLACESISSCIVFGLCSM